MFTSQISFKKKLATLWTSQRFRFASNFKVHRLRPGEYKIPVQKPKINLTGKYEYGFKGKWITCALLKYKSDIDGTTKEFETVGRPFVIDKKSENYKIKSLKELYGGCDVIATSTCPRSGQKIILLEVVYRIPVQRYVISFPAGFQDISETDPIVTALRELKEETGYEGNSSFDHKQIL